MMSDDEREKPGEDIKGGTSSSRKKHFVGNIPHPPRRRL